MKETRLIGRGGQGVVLASEMLSYALAIEEKYVSAFPSFGVERRGAPVFASLRFDNKNIREITQVYRPNCVMIFDRKQSRQLNENIKGIKPDGILIVNLPAKSSPQCLPEKVAAVAVVDANAIALQEIGVSISNTCMLGAFARATGWVKLESVMKALANHFHTTLLQKNMNAARKGYEEVTFLHL